MASSDQPAAPGIVLKPGRDGPIRKRHHPWVYSQAIAEARGGPSPGDPLPVWSADGTALGWGLHSPGSLIAARMVSFGAERPAADWIESRIHRARELREAFHLDSDGLRIVNGEGDFIPGLVVDVYADSVVASMHTRGIEAAAERIVSCLRQMYPDARVFLRRDEHFARVEKLNLPSGYLHGGGDGTTVIREHDIQMLVDYERGQKTGFYLDQRANRATIAEHSAGRSVLNLFAYSGAVALRAAAAGAVRVVSVESSKRALEMGRESEKLNPGLPKGVLQWVQADVFSFLENPGTFDVVVADPPPFARRRMELEGAIKGYLSLFQRCLRILAPGGLAFLFSCSGALDRPTFQQLVAEAALRSDRKVRMLRELHADADHPVAATHPEGEYLKGWMVHAE